MTLHYSVLCPTHLMSVNENEVINLYPNRFIKSLSFIQKIKKNNSKSSEHFFEKIKKLLNNLNCVTKHQSLNN